MTLRINDRVRMSPVGLARMVPFFSKNPIMGTVVGFAMSDGRMMVRVTGKIQNCLTHRAENHTGNYLPDSWEKDHD